jgi:hypothetical protein
MYRLGNRWHVPVTPGPDGIREPVSVATEGPRCVACCHTGQNVHVDPSCEQIVCVDSGACTDRYRDGRSPEQFAADLAAEALTHAAVGA